MEKKIDKIKIYNYLDYIGKDIKDIIEEISNKIKFNDEIYYAGHEKMEWTKMSLNRFISNYPNKENIIYPTKEDIHFAINNSELILKKQNGLFDFINIFLFPCFSDFVREKMNGVTGYCSKEKVILIFINFAGDWKKQLNSTILHELAHSVSKYYQGGLISIGEAMIFDGLAEHYRENILNDGKSPLATALTRIEADKIFEELRYKLNSETLKDYTDIFFGTGKYPNWTGYTLGYNLITKFFQGKNNINWYQILRMDPKDILKEVI